MMRREVVARTALNAAMFQTIKFARSIVCFIVQGERLVLGRSGLTGVLERSLVAVLESALALLLCRYESVQLRDALGRDGVFLRFQALKACELGFQSLDILDELESLLGERRVALLVSRKLHARPLLRPCNLLVVHRVGSGKLRKLCLQGAQVSLPVFAAVEVPKVFASFDGRYREFGGAIFEDHLLFGRLYVDLRKLLVDETVDMREIIVRDVREILLCLGEEFASEF
mmetsp:Transcript_3446/g.8923  ORF Transcript_3446/g.8923 Transcript_3446/m.8923 type:complete len:229 (-) Transcript_3446:1509-2195(-)